MPILVMIKMLKALHFFCFWGSKKVAKWTCFRQVAANLLILLGGTSCYVLKQAYIQNNLINSRISLDLYRQSSGASPKDLAKLNLVEEIIKFAQNEGLNGEGAYQYLIPISGDAVTYIVQAAPDDDLKFQTWWFPVVGTVPYLGFFEKSDRDREADKLRRAGLDIHISGAAAFSSLGWFDDPLYTPMLKHRDGILATLLFHELTHRTLWIAGSVRFNENLAEFIGRTLGEKFLEVTGRASELEFLRNYEADRQALHGWITTLKSALQGIYRKNLPKSEMLQMKAQVIQTAVENQPKFKTFSRIKSDWNNASILATSLYAPSFPDFQKAFDCFKDRRRPIHSFLQSLQAAAKKSLDPFETLHSLCRTGSEGGT